MDSPGGSGSDDPSGCGGSSSGGPPLKKGPWTSAEDNILVAYVQKHGEGNWNNVQKQSGLFRCGKSCRLRWANHLRPNLKKGAFTPEEERLIIELHAKLGNKWARMATQLPGRTDNEIKNYWNTRIKRRQRAGLPVYPPDIQAAINNNGSSKSSGGAATYSSFNSMAGMLVGSSGKMAAAPSTTNSNNPSNSSSMLLDSSSNPRGEFHGLTLQALQQGMVGPLFLSEASSTGSSTTECGSHHVQQQANNNNNNAINTSSNDGSKTWCYDRSLQLGPFPSQHHHSSERQFPDLDHYRLACGAVSSNDVTAAIAGLGRSNVSGVGGGVNHFFLEQAESPPSPPPPPLFSAMVHHDSFLHHGPAVFPTSRPVQAGEDHHRHHVHSDLKLELPSSQLSAAESTSDSTVTPPCGTSQMNNTNCRMNSPSSGHASGPRVGLVDEQRYDSAMFWPPASFSHEHVQQQELSTPIKLEDAMHLGLQPHQHFSSSELGLLDPYSRPAAAVGGPSENRLQSSAAEWYVPQGGLYLGVDTMQPQASQHDNASASIDTVFSHVGSSSSTATGLMAIDHGSNNPPLLPTLHQQHDEQDQHSHQLPHHAAAMHNVNHHHHQQQQEQQLMLGVEAEESHAFRLPQAAAANDEATTSGPAMWELGSCSWNNMPGACQVGEFDCRVGNCLNEQLGCAIY